MTALLFALRARLRCMRHGHTWLRTSVWVDSQLVKRVPCLRCACGLYALDYPDVGLLTAAQLRRMRLATPPVFAIPTPSKGCPNCGAAEVEADTPRTVYACGSNDYDRRPGTLTQGPQCGAVKPVGA